MSVQTYGIVGVPNVTVTMFTDKDTHARMCSDKDGNVLPADAQSRILRGHNQRRLASDGAPEVKIFPVAESA